MVEAGPPQAAPNYWSIHTQPKPTSGRKKSLSSQLQPLVQLLLLSGQELPGKRDKAAEIMKAGYCLVGGKDRAGFGRAQMKPCPSGCTSLTEGVCNLQALIFEVSETGKGKRMKTRTKKRT